MAEISVIIPCYNVENYIVKCLESVKQQTFTNFEVIVVDDESTDNSFKAAQSVVAGDERFKLLKVGHGGLSNARNIGLKKAVGNYIAFIDGDDFVKPMYLETLYNLCEENDADVSICNFIYYYPDKSKGRIRKRRMKNGITKTEDALNYIFGDKKIQNYVWNKMFRRKLFAENDITFPDICFEDVAVTPRLLFFANRIASTSEPLYYYIQRRGSMINMNKISIDKVDDMMSAVAISSAFFNSCGNAVTAQNCEKMRKSFRLKARYFTWQHNKNNFIQAVRQLNMVNKNFKFMRSVNGSFDLPYRVSDD